MRHLFCRVSVPSITIAGLVFIYAFNQRDEEHDSSSSNLVELRAPAGNLPAQQHVTIDGFDAAVLPTGRIITPAGQEVSVGAPKAFGLDLSPDGNSLITSNNGITPFSVTLLRNIRSGNPTTTWSSWMQHSWAFSFRPMVRATTLRAARTV